MELTRQAQGEEGGDKAKRAVLEEQLVEAERMGRHWEDGRAQLRSGKKRSRTRMHTKKPKTSSAHSSDDSPPATTREESRHPGSSPTRSGFKLLGRTGENSSTRPSAQHHTSWAAPTFTELLTRTLAQTILTQVFSVWFQHWETKQDAVYWEQH